VIRLLTYKVLPFKPLVCLKEAELWSHDCKGVIKERFMIWLYSPTPYSVQLSNV